MIVRPVLPACFTIVAEYTGPVVVPAAKGRARGSGDRAVAVVVVSLLEVTFPLILGLGIADELRRGLVFKLPELVVALV